MCSRESNKLAIRKSDSRCGLAPCCVTFISGPISISVKGKAGQFLSHVLALQFYFKFTEPLQHSISSVKMTGLQPLIAQSLPMAVNVPKNCTQKIPDAFWSLGCPIHAHNTQRAPSPKNRPSKHASVE